MATNDTSGTKKVKRRHVFYFSGFDPRGSSFYYRLYRNEAKKQSAVNGMAPTVGLRQRYSPARHGWNIQTTTENHQVNTDYSFLNWDDIIKHYWVIGYFRLILAAFRVIRSHILSGMVFKVMKISRPPAVTGLYPVIFVLVALILATSLGFASSHLLKELIHPAIARVSGIAITVTMTWLLFFWGDKLNVFWLLRIYDFTGKWADNKIPELDQRFEVFANEIAATSQEKDYDEILIVGHSVGAIIAIPVVAKLLTKIDPDRPITFLTLGECIPLLSLLPKAQVYRNELERVAKATNVFWYDITSAIDGACFPLKNPVTISGIAITDKPIVLSARFHTLFTPATYKKIRRDWYKIHFQYLLAHELNGQYDFFAMTAGAQRLGDRFFKIEMRT